MTLCACFLSRSLKSPGCRSATGTPDLFVTTTSSVMALEEACPGTAWAEPPIGNQRKAAARAARNTDPTFISSLHWAGALWPPRVSGMAQVGPRRQPRSEEHTSELQSLRHLVC